MLPMSKNISETPALPNQKLSILIEMDNYKNSITPHNNRYKSNLNFKNLMFRG